MEKPNPKKKLRSVFRWILWVLLVQFILFNISASLYAYRFTRVNDDPALQTMTPDRNLLVKTWRLFSGPRQPRSRITEFLSFPYDTVSLKTGSGIHIDAWYASPDSVARGTVILFHGIGGNKGMLLPEAAEFRYNGYNVMLVDFRAHGNSGGNSTTIGRNESEEVKLAYDYMVGLGEKNVFLYGISAGAVAITRAVANYGLNPSGVFLEMPFASLQDNIRARARQYFRGFGEKPFGFLITLWIGLEKGFNGFQFQTTRYVTKMNCPVLMQWGTADEYVLQSETNRIYRAIASSEKKLVIYDQARHESLLKKDPVKWRREVEQFLMDHEH